MTTMTTTLATTTSTVVPTRSMGFPRLLRLLPGGMLVWCLLLRVGGAPLGMAHAVVPARTSRMSPSPSKQQEPEHGGRVLQPQYGKKKKKTSSGRNSPVPTTAPPTSPNTPPFTNPTPTQAPLVNPGTWYTSIVVPMVPPPAPPSPPAPHAHLLFSTSVRRSIDHSHHKQPQPHGKKESVPTSRRSQRKSTKESSKQPSLPKLSSSFPRKKKKNGHPNKRTNNKKRQGGKKEQQQKQHPPGKHDDRTPSFLQSFPTQQQHPTTMTPSTPPMVIPVPTPPSFPSSAPSSSISFGTRGKQAASYYSWGKKQESSGKKEGVVRQDGKKGDQSRSSGSPNHRIKSPKEAKRGGQQQGDKGRGDKNLSSYGKKGDQSRSGTPKMIKSPKEAKSGGQQKGDKDHDDDKNLSSHGKKGDQSRNSGSPNHRIKTTKEAKSGGQQKGDKDHDDDKNLSKKSKKGDKSRSGSPKMIKSTKEAKRGGHHKPQGGVPPPHIPPNRPPPRTPTVHTVPPFSLPQPLVSSAPSSSPSFLWTVAPSRTAFERTTNPTTRTSTTTTANWPSRSPTTSPSSETTTTTSPPPSSFLFQNSIQAAASQAPGSQTVAPTTLPTVVASDPQSLVGLEALDSEPPIEQQPQDAQVEDVSAVTAASSLDSTGAWSDGKSVAWVVLAGALVLAVSVTASLFYQWRRRRRRRCRQGPQGRNHNNNYYHQHDTTRCEPLRAAWVEPFEDQDNDDDTVS